MNSRFPTAVVWIPKIITLKYDYGGWAFVLRSLSHKNMLLLKPHYTPKQWVAISNTFLLLLVTFMCGLVMYEISILDQRFVNVLDSSTVAIDLLAVNLDNSPKTPFWKNINDGISVYSAFYEINKETHNKLILIIGSYSFKDGVHLDDLRCLIDYGEERNIGIERVDYKVVADYRTIFLYCHSKGEDMPKKVALMSYANTNPKQWMQVQTIYSTMETDSKLAVCVQPVKSNVAVEKVAQFVDFYEMVGIDHFYFYDYEATEDLVGFIRYLKSSGRSIEVLPWNKNVYFGDVYGPWSEHVQDCLHRAMYKYSYIITLDVSDFFVPEENAKLFEMLGTYKKSHGLASNLRLNSTNFCRDPDFRVFSGTSIGNMLFRGNSHLSESNYILFPELTAGIIFKSSVSATIEEKSAVNLPETYGIVHRYKKYCDTSVTWDSSMSNYSKILEKSLLFDAYKQVTRGFTM